MSVGESISQAKKWCNEARSILKLGIMNSQGRAMSGRADDIASELQKLEKAVKAGKIELTPEEVTDYVSEFGTMAKALKEAATANDNSAITLQSNRLEELKRELAVRLKKGTKKEDKLQEKFDETLSENFAREKEVAIKQLSPLKTHAGTAAIAVEIAAIQRDKIDLAQTKHDTGKHEEARDLLREVPAACVAPLGIAGRYVGYLTKLQNIENKLNTLPNPEDVVKDELATIRKDKIDEAKKKAAHTVRDYEGANTILEQAQTEYLTVKKTTEDYAAYKLSKTAAESAMNSLKSHTDKDLVTKETAAAQTDFLDKAATEATGKRWVEAKKLYDDGTARCNELKALAEKIGTNNFKSYKTWGLDMFKPLTTHSQKTEFATDITRIEKRLETVRAALLKGLDKMAENEIGKIYWDCDATKKLMDAHATYVAKVKSDYDPKKTLLPAKTDADFGTQIGEIETQLASATKATGRRVYDSANRWLDTAIAGCVTVQKGVNDRKAYQLALAPIQEAVDKLPADEDPVIGNEAKAVRKLLTAAKTLATAKEFKKATESLPEVKATCEAAAKLASNQTATKNERDLAVGQAEPTTALAEVRKLYEKLKLHAQAGAIDKQLKEIDQKLKDADSALKA